MCSCEDLRFFSKPGVNRGVDGQSLAARSVALGLVVGLPSRGRGVAAAAGLLVHEFTIMPAAHNEPNLPIK